MIKFQLELLLKQVEKSHEIHEDRISKETDIKRCIELIYNVVEDNYLERCGDVYFIKRETFSFEPYELDSEGEVLTYSLKDDRTPYEQAHDEIIRNQSRKLQEEEWNELWNLMKNMQGWWN